MKKSTIAALFMIFTAFSCSKDDDGTTTPAFVTYMSASTGSTRTYEFVSVSPLEPVEQYTLTSTNRDTTVVIGGASRLYHVFTSSNGQSEYFNQTGNDYYTFQTLPAGVGDAIENLYLKADAGLNQQWSQNYTINVQGVDVPVTVVNKVSAKGLSRSINSVTYTEVFEITTTITSSLLPASALVSDIKSYYAPKVGLIENKTKVDINYMGFTETTQNETKIKSSNIL